MQRHRPAQRSNCVITMQECHHSQQYNLLYKPWAKSMGEGDFRHSTARRPLDRFSWNLKYITTSRTRPRMQNFRGLRRRGWSGQIASLTHESFCRFSFLRHAHRSHFWTHPNAQYAIYYASFPPRKCLLGVRKIKVEILPPLPPKNVKIGTLSWRSMDNCSRPNSGTVSRIVFKLGTRIDHPSGITWHDSKVKRSKVKVTRAHNVYS